MVLIPLNLLWLALIAGNSKLQGARPRRSADPAQSYWIVRFWSLLLHKRKGETKLTLSRVRSDRLDSDVSFFFFVQSSNVLAFSEWKLRSSRTTNLGSRSSWNYHTHRLGSTSFCIFESRSEDSDRGWNLLQRLWSLQRRRQVQSLQSNEICKLCKNISSSRWKSSKFHQLAILASPLVSCQFGAIESDESETGETLSSH